MKKKTLLVLLVFGFVVSTVFAQTGGSSVSSAPKIINSKIIYRPDRNSSLNAIGIQEKWVVIRVELREETGGVNKGERYVFLTVTGIREEDGRIVSLSGSELQWYQSNYGGKRYEDFDDIR